MIQMVPNRRWGGPALLVVLAATLAAWTWSRSGEPLIDASKDLYIAQQMSQGRALYGDLCYLFGPLAPSVLAISFGVFGASVHVERTFNLVLFIPVVIILYRMLVDLSDRFAATVACAIYLMLFAFGHLTPLHNYNILTPYTNSATYGLALGIVMVAGLIRFARDPKPRWIALAAGACGLSFLTKPEIFLACFVTFTVGLSAILAARLVGARSWKWTDLLALACLLIAPLLVLIPLAMQSSWAEVISGTLAGYQMALDPDVQSMRFQLEGGGFRSVRQSLSKAIVWACVYGWILLPPLLLSLLPARWKRWETWIGLASAVVVFAVVRFVPDDTHWPEIFMGVPVVLAGAIVVLGWNVIREHRRGGDLPLAVGRLILAIFALGMLARMILNARIYHYGFVLAAVAMMVVVIMLLSWVPQALERMGHCGGIIRWASLGMLGALVLVHLTATRGMLDRQTIDMGWGFRGGGIGGELLKQATGDLMSRAAPGDTLAAFPACPWVNFVSRMPNPTPYELLDPLGFIRAGGEERVLAAYQSSPPTWIMLVHQDMSEYGAALFGVHYAQDLNAWIEQHYQRVALYGAEPLKSRAFGIALLRRRTDQPS